MFAATDKLSSLQQALQLTQRMLSLAKQQSWDDLSPLEQQREALLQAVFPVDKASQTDSIAEAIRELIEANHQLVAQCQSGKHSLQMQMRDAKFTQKAVSAYQSN